MLQSHSLEDATAHELAQRAYDYQCAQGITLPKGTSLAHIFAHLKPVMEKVLYENCPTGLGISPQEEIMVDIYNEVLGGKRRSSDDLHHMEGWNFCETTIPPLQELSEKITHADEEIKSDLPDGYDHDALDRKIAVLNDIDAKTQNAPAEDRQYLEACINFERSRLNVDHVTLNDREIGHSLTFKPFSSEEKAKILYDALILRDAVNDNILNYYPGLSSYKDVLKNPEKSAAMPGWLFLVPDRDKTCHPFTVLKNHNCDLVAYTILQNQNLK